MKTSYNATLFHPDLTKATFELEIFDRVKWIEQDDCKRVTYKGVTQWDLIEGGDEAEEIESQTDENSADEYHHYLVLHFEDGSTSTFRNSHVVMFIL